MKLRDAKWSICACCGRRDTLLQDETYGCDECKKTIDPNKKNVDYLEASLFYRHMSEDAPKYTARKVGAGDGNTYVGCPMCEHVRKENAKLRAELLNIANAKRSNFTNADEFMAWAQNRARFTLGEG